VGVLWCRRWAWLRMTKRNRRVYRSPKPEAMPDPVDFELDEVVYICRELGPLEISEIARMHGAPADDPKSLAFMAELFETLLGAQQYRVFRANAGRFETRPEIFIEIIQGVFEDMTSRNPTERSVSSDGSESDGTNSTGDLSSRVMSRLEGRPDLQMAIELARENR